MFLIIGGVIVIACVLGGFAAHGGHLGVLWQPLEMVIIIGAAVGGFLIANPKSILSGLGPGFKAIMTGTKYKKDNYIELLSLMYQIFKMAKTKGMLALEPHVENPEESTLFSQFPNFQHDHHAIEFICDYLRMMTLGSDNPNEMEDLMNEELDIHHHDQEQVASAIQNMADAFPALGIVAAVLGVITTMGSLTEPPEVLGHLIGAALVGTFLGILISYGYVAPMANALKLAYGADSRFFVCMKVGLLAYLKGYAPAVSVEFARKAISSDVRPTFYEVEEAVSQLPSP